MKNKRWLSALMLLVILVPFIRGIVGLFPIMVEAVGPDAPQVLVNDQTVYVEASYTETETTYDWHLEFQKKATPNKQRLRIAIDHSSTGFGTIYNIRGQGLGQSGDGAIATMKVTDDGNNYDWYYTPDYSEAVQSGSLDFSTDKSETAGQVPVVVSLDTLEEVSETEVNDTVPPEAEEPVKESAGETENTEAAGTPQEPETSEAEQPENSEEIPAGTEDNNVVEETENPAENPTDNSDAEASNESSEAISDSEEIIEEVNAFTGSLPLYAQIQRNPLIGSSIALGPFAQSDPFLYDEQKLLLHSTSDYITDFQTVTDGSQEANWHNYNYAENDDDSVAVGASGHGPTMQLWGNDRDFANSYTSYNGAYVKKWVEPVKESSAADSTATYNVYLEVVGTADQEIVKQKLDIVFVLDKSGSMGSSIHGEKKDESLKEAVSKTVKMLFNNHSLDVKVGLVDFYGHTEEGMTANIFPLSSKLNEVLNSSVLNSSARQDQGTPLALGLQKGYQVLYGDTSDASREKILIVVGDGQPTISYSGIKGALVEYGKNDDPEPKPSASSSKWSNNFSDLSNYWSKNTNFQYLKNYDAAIFDTNDEVPTEFRKGNELTDGKYEKGKDTNYRYFDFGEIASGNTSAYFYGDGTSSTKQDKNNAINTVAYHRWLAAKYNSASVYSVGIGINNTGKTVLKNISAENYYDANSTEDLLAALIDITSAGGKTLNNASLIDKLSSNVSLTSNDVETSYYKLPEVQTNLSEYGTPQRWTNQTPSVQTQPLEEGGFQFSNITLGQGEMVRLKYQIRLKSDAQNGEFQTVSQETYLMNGPTADTNKKMYLPVPSIRYQNQERDIVVKKQDIFGNPIPGVTFELSKVKRQVEGSSQTNANGEAGFAFDFPSNGKSSPKYQIQETKAPNQYQKLSGSLTFQVSKSSDKFSLTNETSGSKTSYNDLPNWWNKAGSKTDTWPFGYSGSNHVFSITQTKKNNNPPTVHLTVKNQFKPLEISVLKVDGDKPLPNAKFQLREAGKDGKFTRVLGEGVSNDAGVVTFYRSSTGEKKPLTLEISTESKKYRIYETQAPENYEDPSEDDYWEIEVNPATQNITYHRNGEEQSQVETQFEKIATEAGQTLPLQLKIENQQQAADLVIVKKQGEQILNGVSFELSRNETGFTSNKSTYKAYSGLQGVKESSGLSWSEAGAGNFFQALNGDKYQDLDFSAPFVLEKGQYTLTEEETLVGYLKNQKDWQIEVEESGEVILAEDSSGAKIEKTEISGKLTWVVSVENQLLPIDLTVKKNDRYNSEKMLSGAEFTATKKENGKWLEPDNLIEVEDSGNYQLAKLELGTYKIEETTAPSGYQRLSGYFELEIRQADANFIDASGKLIEKGSLMAEVQYYLDSQPSGEKETVSLKEEKGRLQIEFTVSNNPYNPLPATGGIGRLGQFLIAAGLLTASLFVGWLTKRLKGREAGLHD